MAFLQIEAVGKTFVNREVLRNVNLSIEEGEFVSIVGTSGSGKTTLLKIASGLVPASTGTLTIAGKPVVGFPRKASVVFQNYSLLPWLSASANVALAVESEFPE